MIDSDEFVKIANRTLDIDLTDSGNVDQLRAVVYRGDDILQIVAGPGSGKTSALVLRALRSVFVESVLPENILITTFTRKAAGELRTRWLDWGTAFWQAISDDVDSDLVDLNRCRIDTIDSIMQQTLTEFRSPGSVAPMLMDSAASKLLFKRAAFYDLYRQNKSEMDLFLRRYTFEGALPRNQGEALGEAKRLVDRLIQDRVDIRAYSGSGRDQSIVVQMLQRYREDAAKRNAYDFGTLADGFLERLSDGSLADWIEDLHVVLVDEYQDTNPLQEAIYFEIVRQSPGVAMTVVGDDDQSMYRFRGGSVELFTRFAERCEQATGRKAKRVDMVQNFRSRPRIVEFYNEFINNDPRFVQGRIVPAKPVVVAARCNDDMFPVIGMFREDARSLAYSIAEFVAELLRNRSVALGPTGSHIELSREGAPGDMVFLSHSVEELQYDRYRDERRTRFPGMLRSALRTNGCDVFNARGQALRSIENVRVLLGVALLAVDPDDTIVGDVRATNEARFFLNGWREAGRCFVESDPGPHGIDRFVTDWQAASSGTVKKGFPPDWPVLELLFKLITWMPAFPEEPEHQVWLEAITRLVASSAMVSPYRMKLYQNTSARRRMVHVRRSRESFVRDALLPIAENEVDVDEDVMPSVPRDRFQFMTIHQAKGLEFPLVIVDVGSQFKTNHHKQRFLRFPDKVSNVVQSEDDVEPYLREPLRGARKSIDRTFDDLVRLYYVAYSRPQSVLMLVGCEKCLTYGTGNGFKRRAIPNVALFWQRDGNWPWRQSLTSRKPPIRVEPRFLEV